MFDNQVTPAIETASIESISAAAATSCPTAMTRRVFSLLNVTAQTSPGRGCHHAHDTTTVARPGKAGRSPRGDPH
jgi:hypothetical protein